MTNLEQAIRYALENGMEEDEIYGIVDEIMEEKENTDCINKSKLVLVNDFMTLVIYVLPKLTEKEQKEFRTAISKGVDEFIVHIKKGYDLKQRASVIKNDKNMSDEDKIREYLNLLMR